MCRLHALWSSNEAQHCSSGKLERPPREKAWRQAIQPCIQTALAWGSRDTVMRTQDVPQAMQFANTTHHM